MILGAGLDTRAYRIARHSDLPVFEVDQQVNIDRKTAVVRRVLGAAARVGSSGAGRFRARRPDVHPVRSTVITPTRATFFIWEGVTQYLTPEAVRATLEQLRRAAPGSRLMFTYVRQDFIDGENLYGAQTLYRRFRQRQPGVAVGLGARGGRRVPGRVRLAAGRTGRAELLRDAYIRPTGRKLTASQIEWTALRGERS